MIVTPFTWNFSDGVPQPNTSSQLRTTSHALMFPLGYRNYGDHESLTVNHTINVGGGVQDQAAVRWYEIRGGTVDATFSDAVIHQQGNYAPDSGTNRWMGSVAMDYVGNLAIGYNVSASNVYPGLRYTGRHSGDALNQLIQQEAILIAGGGSQTSTTGYWGYHSAISVDPTDECTFWYAGEYMASTSLMDWQTRIGSFKFADCCKNPGEYDVPGLTVSKSGNDVVLRWDDTGATTYEVYRAADDPYFTPSSSNVIAQTNATEITEPDLGSTSINYYYKVRSLDGCEPSNSSYVQRVGEFDYSLTPGSN